MMREVSKDEFFATVGQLDVVLRCEPNATYWETRHRALKGKSTPGYMGDAEKRWYVSEDYK